MNLYCLACITISNMCFLFLCLSCSGHSCIYFFSLWVLRSDQYSCDRADAGTCGRLESSWSEQFANSTDYILCVNFMCCLHVMSYVSLAWFSSEMKSAETTSSLIRGSCPERKLLIVSLTKILWQPPPPVIIGEPQKKTRKHGI